MSNKYLLNLIKLSIMGALIAAERPPIQGPNTYTLEQDPNGPMQACGRRSGPGQPFRQALSDYQAQAAPSEKPTIQIKAISGKAVGALNISDPLAFDKMLQMCTHPGMWPMFRFHEVTLNRDNIAQVLSLAQPDDYITVVHAKLLNVRDGHQIWHMWDMIIIQDKAGFNLRSIMNLSAVYAVNAIFKANATGRHTPADLNNIWAELMEREMTDEERIQQIAHMLLNAGHGDPERSERVKPFLIQQLQKWRLAHDQWPTLKEIISGYFAQDALPTLWNTLVYDLNEAVKNRNIKGYVRSMVDDDPVTFKPGDISGIVSCTPGDSTVDAEEVGFELIDSSGKTGTVILNKGGSMLRRSGAVIVVYVRVELTDQGKEKFGSIWLD